MTEQSKKIGCGICKHNRRDGTCAAFPERIPFIYLAGSYSHIKVIEGQTGDYVFEWGTPEELKAISLAAIAKHDRREVAV